MGSDIGWWIGLISGSWSLLLGAIGIWRSLRVWLGKRRKVGAQDLGETVPGPPAFTVQRLVEYWHLLWQDQAKALYLGSKTLTLGLGVLFSMGALLFWAGAVLAAMLAILTGDVDLGRIAGGMGGAGGICLLVVLVVIIVGGGIWYGSSRGLVQLRKSMQLSGLEAQLAELSRQKSAKQSWLRYVDSQIADNRQKLGLTRRNAEDAGSEAALEELLGRYAQTREVTQLRADVEDRINTKRELPIIEKKMKQIRAEIERIRREELVATGTRPSGKQP